MTDQGLHVPHVPFFQISNSKWAGVKDFIHNLKQHPIETGLLMMATGGGAILIGSLGDSIGKIALGVGVVVSILGAITVFTGVYGKNRAIYEFGMKGVGAGIAIMFGGALVSIAGQLLMYGGALTAAAGGVAVVSGVAKRAKQRGVRLREVTPSASALHSAVGLMPLMVPNIAAPKRVSSSKAVNKTRKTHRKRQTILECSDTCEARS